MIHLVRGRVKTVPEDGSALDAFSRQRVAQPFTIFESTNEYGLNTHYWNTKTSGSGTVTEDVNTSSVILATTSASGDLAVLQSAQYHKYQPGKSQKIAITFALGNSAVGTRKRVGYFDGGNGIFLEQDRTDGLFIVKRSNTSGTVVDTRVPQSTWGLDKMDGSGPSKTTLNPANAQILVIDLQWLGVGRVRVGFNIDGMLLYVHEFKHANNLDVPYMRTATLPIRYEIQNTGTSSGTPELLAICSTVISEGGWTPLTLPFTINNGATGVSVTTRRPILSIRLATTYNSVVNRMQAFLAHYGALVTGSFPALIEIVHDGVLSGGAGVWSSVDTLSGVERNLDHTTITGGRVHDSFYVDAGSVRGATSKTAPHERLPLGLNIDGDTSGTYSIVATGIGGSATIYSSLEWQEVR